MQYEAGRDVGELAGTQAGPEVSQRESFGPATDVMQIAEVEGNLHYRKGGDRYLQKGPAIRLISSDRPGQVEGHPGICRRARSAGLFLAGSSREVQK